MLRQSGRVGVEELATHFGVTLQTIRRDLNELSEAKVLVRVHGGAMIASGVANLAYEARQHVAQQSKRLIGEAAARLVPDNASLLINIGTTTEEVAKALSSRSGLLVITNNLHVANELYRNQSVQVIITGGSIRKGDGGIVGAVAVEQIEQFRADLAIIGTSAIDPDGTLLDFDVHEVQISRAIIEHARKIVLVADSSKFSRSAPSQNRADVGNRYFCDRSPAIRGRRPKCAAVAASKSSRPGTSQRPKTASPPRRSNSVNAISFFSVATFKMFVVASFANADRQSPSGFEMGGRGIAHCRARQARLSL